MLPSKSNMERTIAMLVSWHRDYSQSVSPVFAEDVSMAVRIVKEYMRQCEESAAKEKTPTRNSQ